MSKVERKCEWCAKPFTARSADVKRGWARFCGKSCKASHQEAFNRSRNMGGKKAVKRQTRHDRLDDERSERELFEERHQQALYESSSCHGQD